MHPTIYTPEKYRTIQLQSHEWDDAIPELATAFAIVLVGVLFLAILTVNNL